MKRIFMIFLICMIYIGNVFAREVWVSGESAAITLRYEGIYVTGTYVVTQDGSHYDPSANWNIVKGDLIIAVNNQRVSSIEELYTSITTIDSDNNEISVKILRSGNLIDGTLQVYKKNEFPILGLYLKDKITGIGTITYFDESKKTFGTLGHSLMNHEEGHVSIRGGTLYAIPILSIRKSSRGGIGEKIADTASLTYLGAVMSNTIYGVYGNYSNKSLGARVMETAPISEVHIGSAHILTVLEGKKVEQFEIEIDRVNVQNQQDIKGIHFVIKDKRLVEKTGGIVQGMSGSPIIQNGKLIGAVTHVIVSSPLEGYGVYIEFMLKESDKVS